MSNKLKKYTNKNQKENSGKMSMKKKVTIGIVGGICTATLPGGVVAVSLNVPSSNSNNASNTTSSNKTTPSTDTASTDKKITLDSTI